MPAAIDMTTILAGQKQAIDTSLSYSATMSSTRSMNMDDPSSI